MSIFHVKWVDAVQCAVKDGRFLFLWMTIII